MHNISNQQEAQKTALLNAILARFPHIPQYLQDIILSNVNPKRKYYLKCISNKQKFLNHATREVIVSENKQSISEVLPLFGNFCSGLFESIAGEKRMLSGDLDESTPAVAVKIQVGRDSIRTSFTYTLIIYIPVDKASYSF